MQPVQEDAPAQPEDPMELPENHPDAAAEDVESDVPGGDDEDGGDDSGPDGVDDDGYYQDDSDGGDDEPEDPPTPDAAAGGLPIPPFEKFVHYLGNVEEGFLALLWKAMQLLGIRLKPRFKAVQYERPNQPTEWIVLVQILVPDHRYGTQRLAHYHRDGAFRRTMKAGVSEAARRALNAMCHTYREEL